MTPGLSHPKWWHLNRPALVAFDPSGDITLAVVEEKDP